MGIILLGIQTETFGVSLPADSGNGHPSDFMQRMGAPSSWNKAYGVAVGISECKLLVVDLSKIVLTSVKRPLIEWSYESRNGEKLGILHCTTMGL